MISDDAAVASAAVVSCEITRLGAAFMLLREGEVRVGRSSLRIMTSDEPPALAALVHLKDVAAIFLSYREAEEDAGVSIRTNDVLLDLRRPERVFKLTLRDFDERCKFVDALADQTPWAELSHLDASGVDAIFGTGEYDQDSDAETILSQTDDELEDLHATHSESLSNDPESNRDASRPKTDPDEGSDDFAENDSQNSRTRTENAKQTPSDDRALALETASETNAPRRPPSVIETAPVHLGAKRSQMSRSASQETSSLTSEMASASLPDRVADHSPQGFDRVSITTPRGPLASVTS